MQTSRFRALQFVTLLYTQFFVSVPVLIVLFFCYYGLPRLYDVEISSFAAATMALAAHASAMLSTVIAAGITSVGRGQWEAAQVSGMTYPQTMRHVILPQAAQVILPPFVGVYIRLIKESSIAALIGYVELTQTGLLIRESTHAGLAIVGVVALIYFVINYSISLAGGAIERRMKVAGRGPLGARQ
jgi:polar amino acid transport system permease protein